MQKINEIFGTLKINNDDGIYTQQLKKIFVKMNAMDKDEKEKFLDGCRNRLKDRWDKAFSSGEFSINKYSGVTKEYIEMKNENKIDRNKLLDINVFSDFYSNGKKLIYGYGDNRIGKSITLQDYLLDYTKAFNLRGLYIMAIEIVYKITTGEALEKKHFINRLVYEYDILIIDEVDKIVLSDTREMIMFYILDKRKTANRITILCGNEPIDNLEKRLGKIIVSRIKNEAGIINMR